VPAKRFDQAKPFLVLGLVLAVWLIAPVVLKRLARASFFEAQAPIEYAAATVRSLQDFWSLRSRSKNDLIEAGQQVSHLIAHYETSTQANAALRGEIARLEELLRLPSFPAYRSEAARVVRRDLNAWWHRILIRKGSNYGITVGAPVIFIGGVVGRVTEVGAYTAVVELISSPGVRLAGSISGDNRPINYQGGNNPTFGVARGRAEYVPLDLSASPAAPLRLVTSGLGGVFPPGLVIGQISQLEAGADGLFNAGDVLLDPRLNAVSEVTVLVPLKKE
jgi:rod shape-determining protein MreC